LLIYLGKKMAERDSSGYMTAKQATPKQATPKQATPTQVVGSAIPKPGRKATPLGSATPKEQDAKKPATFTNDANEVLGLMITLVCTYLPESGGEANKTVRPGTMEMVLALHHAMEAVKAVAAQLATEAPEINYANIIAELEELIVDMLHDDQGCIYLNNACRYAFNTFVRTETGPPGYVQPMFNVIEENIGKRTHDDEQLGKDHKKKQYEFIRTVFTYIAPRILEVMKSVSQ
jgi:hypothetical protein